MAKAPATSATPSSRELSGAERPRSMPGWIVPVGFGALAIAAVWFFKPPSLPSAKRTSPGEDRQHRPLFCEPSRCPTPSQDVAQIEACQQSGTTCGGSRGTCNPGYEFVTLELGTGTYTDYFDSDGKLVGRDVTFSDHGPTPIYGAIPDCVMLGGARIGKAMN